MPVLSRQSKITTLHRRVAVLTTLIFLWLSAGASLTHTDSCFDELASFAAASPLIAYSPSESAAPHLPCAACEWSALQVLSPAVFVLAVAFLPIREVHAFSLTDTLFRRVTFASLRAPPFSL